MEEFEFHYYTPSQFHHTLIQSQQTSSQNQQQHQQQPQQAQQFLSFQTNTQNSSSNQNKNISLTDSNNNLRCNTSGNSSGNATNATSNNSMDSSSSNTNNLNSTINLLSNLNDTTDQLQQHHHNRHTIVNTNSAQQQNSNNNNNNNSNNNSNTRNKLMNNSNQSQNQNNTNNNNNNNNNNQNNNPNTNRSSMNDNRTNTTATASVVYAMDRLSPYANFEDSRANTNLSNLTLDQIFKSNPNDDTQNLVVVNSNESILLLNQNLECLKQFQNSAGQNSTNCTNPNVNVNHAGSLGPSSSPSATSTLSNLDVNNQMSSSSSPQSSSPSSSSNDTNSNYGTNLASSILNGTLTPPPDNGANSLTNDSLVSSNVFNPFNVKVENIQILDCNMNQQQQQQQNQAQSQLQHSHHQQQSLKQANNLLEAPTLVSLVPPSSTSSSMNPILQQVVPNSNNSCLSMMNLISPSKPSNISELSNSSMVSSSSGSSTTLDSSSTLIQVNSGSQQSSGSNRRTRASKIAQDLQKDGKYFERRKRNNVAAKKSRDARKQREDEIAIRASFLEKENSILKAQLQTLKDEAQQLRILLAQKKSNQSMLSNGIINNSCANCSNCSALAAAAAVANSVQNCSKSINTYVNPSLGSLGQLNTYDHTNDQLGIDKQLGATNSNQASNSLNNPSIYLQHQNQHRHQII